MWCWLSASVSSRINVVTIIIFWRITMIEKILVNGRVVLVSSSKTQLNNCFDHFALDDGNEITSMPATSDELNDWSNS
jgi:hypothetical protein